MRAECLHTKTNSSVKLFIRTCIYHEHNTFFFDLLAYIFVIL